MNFLLRIATKTIASVAALAIVFVSCLLSADLKVTPAKTIEPPTAEPEEPRLAKPKVILLPSPVDAPSLALAELAKINPYSHCYIRWIWVPSGDVAAMRVTSLVLNYISRGDVIARPIPVANGHLLMIDLNWIASDDPVNKQDDLTDVLRVWEEFAYDPTFNLLITKDSVEFAEKFAELAPFYTAVVTPAVVTPAYEKTIVVDHKGGPYTYPDDTHYVTPDMPAGQYTVTLHFDAKNTPAVTKRVARNVDVLRVNSPWLPIAMSQLQARTHSLAPIVEYKYFITRAMTSIKDDGVFRQVMGGLYYDLRGVKKAKDVLGKDTKATDLDLFFENLGIGNIKAGLTQEKLFGKLRSDQRMAQFRSEVTGKPREISSFHVPSAKESSAWGAITGDIRDTKTDFGDRSFANLLSPRRDAREAIFPTRTGFPVFALFNGAGALQDEVPPDIAIDNTIPAPYTRRLQSAIGCVRCHGTDGSDGWKEIRNDIQAITKGRFDIFGDLSQGRRAFDPITINRMAGLFAGDFSDNLAQARNGLARATLRATGLWKDGGAQADVAKIASQALADAYREHNYDLVDARAALRSLGYEVNKKRAIEVFSILMSPENDPNVGGIFLDSPTFAAIKSDVPVLQSDWSMVYSQAMGRALVNARKLR